MRTLLRCVWRTKEDVQAYLEICQVVVKKVESTLQQRSVPHLEITLYLRHCERQIEQVDRDRISHEEKVFSVYEEHTRWIGKGKPGIIAELGVPVCVMEDEHPFILHHMIQCEGTDAALLTEAKKRYGAVVSCSKDKGFCSPDNLAAIEAELELAVMPRKAKGTEASRERERAEAFVAARRPLSQRSTTWSTADRIVCGRTARRGLRASWRFRLWRRMCIGSD